MSSAVMLSDATLNVVWPACLLLSTIMFTTFMLSVAMLSFIMLSVVIRH
jgi:hypothetical protein